MEGLSPAANALIEPLSSLEILKDYYLIGGTSLAIQIRHRLSEDLDFCQWIPRFDVHNAIPFHTIREGLKERFGNLKEDQLSFHQVNYVIEEPRVKLTFYQTTLTKPEFKAIPLMGNIALADLNVLGGSKMFVITTRDALRDYYDLFVLVKDCHLTVQEMVEQAKVISRKTTPEALFKIFNGFSFDGKRFDLSDLDKLEAKYPVKAEEYVAFCNDVADQIREIYGLKVPNNAPVLRTATHLRRKIESADKVLTNVVENSKVRFGLTNEEITDMIRIGPYSSHLDGQKEHFDGMENLELEERLDLRSGSIKNVFYNLKERYSLSNTDLRKIQLASA